MRKERRELKERMVARFDRLNVENRMDNSVIIDPEFDNTKIRTKTLQKIMNCPDDHFCFILRDLESCNYWLSI